MSSAGLCLLSLDGGGVRGLSTLFILREIMVALNHARELGGQSPVKPCDVFDLIGGTSTGGLIAIMLGRLEMDVDECIEAYTKLSEAIFSKRESRFGLGIKGNLKAKFSSQRLREAIESVLREKGFALDAPFNDKHTDISRSCRVFVCSCDRTTKDILRIKSYDIPGKSSPIRPLTIVEAALATSAAPSFFDKIDIDDVIYLDGALGANNPVKQVAREASDIWFKESGEPDLQENVKCVLSLGTGHPGIGPVRDDKAYKFLSETLTKMVTDTEKIAEEFADSWRGPLNKGCYFRFNVQHGLENVGLEEFKKKGEIQSSTRSYLEQRMNQLSVGRCVTALKEKENNEFQLQMYHPFRLERIARRWEVWFGKKLCDDIFERISDYDPDHDLRLIARQRCPETTEWILSDPYYQAWKADSAGTLWLTGKIGSGKTFITATVVEDLFGSTFVGYHFFQPLRSSRLRATDLFRSYIWQMIAFMDAVELQVSRDIVSDITRIFGLRSSFPSLTDIVSSCFLPLAKTMARHKLKNFYIVDGLDACTPEEYSCVLTSFRDLVSFVDCHVFISAREVSNGQGNSTKVRTIQLSGRHTCDDIRVFISWKMEEKERTEGRLTPDEKLRAHVIEVLNSRAHLMILWVTLQIDAIWNCATDQEIRQALADLPENLTETYSRSASRIRKPLGPRVLSYICATLIPFQIAELQEFLAIDATSGRILRENIPQERLIIKSCAGLATRTEDDLVVPTHHSAVLFLEKNGLPLEIHEEKFDTEKSRLTLGELCVRHLTGPDYALQVSARAPKFTMEIMPGPFLQVPLLPNLFKIPRLFDNKKRTSIQFDASLATALRKPELHVSHLNAFRYARANWALLTRQMSPQSPFWLQFKEIVLEKRLSWDVLPWSPSGRSVDSHYQDLLGWAITRSHVPMLHVLLHESIPEPRKEIFDLPLPQYEDQLPLELAILAKSTEILKSLLPRCAKPGLPQLMHLAAKTGFHGAIDMLLDSSDHDAQDIFHDITLLAVAAQFGHHQFVSRLFRAPFRLHTRQMSYALAMASRTGNCSMIQTLLRLGVPIELPPDEDTIPLSEAAKYGHVDAVRILLQAGASLAYAFLERPLVTTVKSGHVIVAQALLHHGDNPNDPKTWPTLLHLAIIDENIDMVQLLLQRGANPNLCPSEPTPLELAVKKALLPAAQLLMNYGANTNDSGVRNRSSDATILHWACIGGSVEILELLRTVDNEPLHNRMINEPRDELKPFKVHSSDRLGRSAIMIAAASGNLSVFRYLLEHHAAVHDVDCSYVSVLMYACGAELRNDTIYSRYPYPGVIIYTRPEDYTAIVRLLCKRGVNLDACDNEGKTAFMYAAREFNLETLKTLAKNGADVKWIADVKGKSCHQQNALSYATSGSTVTPYNGQQLECIEFLKSLGL